MAVRKQPRKGLVAAEEQTDLAWDPELSAGQRHLAEHLEAAQRVLKRRFWARRTMSVTFLGVLALGLYGCIFYSILKERVSGDQEAAADQAAKSATS